MRMDATTRERLRAAIAPLDFEERREFYRQRKMERAEVVRDVDERYRWDLLRAAIGTNGICDLYGQGLNDSHIDTGLRSIVRPL